MDGGVWQATINGISESCTQLSNFTSHESVCLVLLAARSPDYISPNQGKNRLGNTHSQSTLHWNLCFLNGTVSVHYKSLYTALNVQGNGLPWIWDSRKYGKISILLLWKQDTCSLKPATKTHWVIFLCIMTTPLVLYLIFLKETHQNQSEFCFLKHIKLLTALVSLAMWYHRQTTMRATNILYNIQLMLGESIKKNTFWNTKIYVILSTRISTCP